MFTGAAKRRKDEYELALFHAWHVAMWTVLAQNGKLKDWAEYRKQLRNEPDVPVAVDWRARKAQRAEQVGLLNKHKAKRSMPVRGKR